MLDVHNTNCKLDKGLNALNFIDTNINGISEWLTGVEQKLNEIQSTQPPEKKLEAQQKFNKVNFITNLTKNNCIYFLNIYFVCFNSLL